MVKLSGRPRVRVQGVKSLGGYFACLCQEFEFYEVKKNVIIFQIENGNTSTLLINFIRVSVQGVKLLSGHFACLCRGFEFYEVKKKLLLFFKKKMEILLHF